MFFLDFGWSWISPSASDLRMLLQTGSCHERLQSLDGIPQRVPYWLDGVSIGMDTRLYEYFSLCYDDPAPGQG